MGAAPAIHRRSRRTPRQPGVGLHLVALLPGTAAGPVLPPALPAGRETTESLPRHRPSLRRGGPPPAGGPAGIPARAACARPLPGPAPRRPTVPEGGARWATPPPRPLP